MEGEKKSLTLIQLVNNVLRESIVTVPTKFQEGEGKIDQPKGEKCRTTCQKEGTKREETKAG